MVEVGIVVGSKSDLPVMQTYARIQAAFPGSPAPGLRQGVEVKVTGLVVSDWAMNDRHGLSFRATKVEAAQAQKAGAA